MNMTFNERVEPLFGGKLGQIAAALTTTKPGTLDHDSLILELKALMVGLIGEDDVPTADDAFDTIFAARQACNQLRAELREKVKDLK
ncbi:MAG TPA: hypothetical protein VFT87_05525 [Candidatus Saccharimonadales bacterium]|nr:hypothetical protein [Candidatus Saccharimonadales bacterium]